MYFRIDELVVRNLCTYGNSETRFKFSEGLSLITAKNGSGKSAFFLDGLCYNLYGKPYRDIKIAELVNRKNKKGLFTEGVYWLDKDNKIRILRSPQKLEIYKNDDKEPMKTSSSKLLDQEEINKMIGIDHHIFKLVLAVAASSNEPFLSLGLPKKREVMESIFSIKIFGEMLKKARGRLNSYKTEKTILQNSLKIQESNLISSKSNLDKLTKTVADFEENKKNELDNLISRENNFIKSLEKTTKELSEIDLSKIETDPTDYNKKLIDLSTSIQIEEKSSKEKKQHIKLLQKANVCVFCNSELTEEHKNLEIQKLETAIKDSETKITKIKKQIENLNLKIKTQKEQKNLWNETFQKQQTLSFTQSSLESDIKNINLQKKTIQEREIKIDLEAIRAEHISKVNAYKFDKESFDNVSKSVSNYEIVSKVLSEEGIKSYFFKRLIPILNKKINEYLNIFDLPFTINFNQAMEECISEIGSNEKNISYNTFSEGEKKRMDIAILLSFISTMKLISNWNCNVLIFDEILDSATDTEGLEKLLGSIKEMTLNDNQLCTYVISHREAFQDLYTNVIKIKKVNGFSKIEVSNG